MSTKQAVYARIFIAAFLEIPKKVEMTKYPSIGDKYFYIKK
jgi:hypothetical protein